MVIPFGDYLLVTKEKKNEGIREIEKDKVTYGINLFASEVKGFKINVGDVLYFPPFALLDLEVSDNDNNPLYAVKIDDIVAIGN